MAFIHSAGINISFKFLKTYLYTLYTYLILPNFNNIYQGSQDIAAKDLARPKLIVRILKIISKSQCFTEYQLMDQSKTYRDALKKLIFGHLFD